MNNQKIPHFILFDIDGTLLDHVGSGHPGNDRFERAIKEIFDKDVHVAKDYNGWVDRQIAWDLVKDKGIDRSFYNIKFTELAHALHKYAREQFDQQQSNYFVIPGVAKLLDELSRRPSIYLGLLTGNVERMAWWKLEHTGLKKYFHFGLFGDEVDNRIQLAHTVFDKANQTFRIKFQPEQVFVIGDTVYDIRCGKAIGAKTIAVMTGGHTTRENMEKEKPDVLVDTLMDSQVYRFLDL